MPDRYVDDGTGAHAVMFARLGFDYTHGREADIPRDSEHSSGVPPPHISPRQFYPLP